MKKILLFVTVLMAVLVSCSKVDLDDVMPDAISSEKRLELNVAEFPYPTLSSYRFFKGRMVDHRPRPGLLPFAPISTLFTDYAKKMRFVWMPEGAMAQFNGDSNILSFPDGAVLVKTFYYDHVQPANARRVIETRLMFKRNGGWEFANYVWNNEQTEAVLDLGGSFTAVNWLDDNNVQRSVNYRIPADAECHTCHKAGDLNVPIGTKPQSLNNIHPYMDGPRNQLQKWVEEGYLAPGYPKRIRTTVRWDDPSEDLDERVRSYIDMNCAHCHRDDSHCDYRPMRFAYSETLDPVNLGVCVPPDDPIVPGQTHIVARGNSARSMLYFRISSTDESIRMPLLGRTIVHSEGVALIGEWIDSLSPPCN